MELDFNKILTENWVILFFLVITLGSLLAKIRVGGVALGTINDAAKSTVPSLGYAGTYTFANVFLTFAGTLMMAL